jgi:hypothetical protein
MGKFCSQCGTANPDEGKFCRSCGNMLDSAAAQGSGGQSPIMGFPQGDGKAEYTIEGSDMQYVELELEPGECLVAEAGALMYMEQGAY